MDAERYRVNEIFWSIQGEGVRAGAPSLFLRLAKCNLRCAMEPGPKSPGGFDCDTEFESGRELTAAEIVAELTAALAVVDLAPSMKWVVVTGGEPGLQLDRELCDALHGVGLRIAVETNGSILLPHEPVLGRLHDMQPQDALATFLVDWITVSPKVAEHAIRQLWAHEVKYVRGHGQGVPQTRVVADHQLISPAFLGEQYDPRAVAWCRDLVLRHPAWRLSMQQHKAWGIR